MNSLKTVRIKPNPVGKDRNRNGQAGAKQLGAEWADVKNEGPKPVSLEGVSLQHIAYRHGSSEGRWEIVTGFKGSLAPGLVMRVHSGHGPVTALAPEDLAGADAHLFTGRDQYVWNNDRGDCPALWLSGQQVPFDKACYHSAPPEGAVLIRVGDRLVAGAGVLSAQAAR